MKRVATYCYQCVAGPDLLTVKVDDGGNAREVEPNFAAAPVHPGGGKVCVKAYGLIQKTYHPDRVLRPMKRTNPKKGHGEDPGFVPIAWDEALGLITEKLLDVRSRGLVDESGYPRVAASFGGGGTPQSYMGSFPAFLAAWGPVDMGFGSGQGVKCYHSEHLYGELWHRGFTVSPDTPLTNYLISCGANVEASGGVAGVWRHANARERGMKRVQVEPHLSVTGACSAEWVPIKPKTDAAFLYALIHVMLHEAPREKLDIQFLTRHTSSPYLVGANGFYLREPATGTPIIAGALETKETHVSLETGADGEVLGEGSLEGETAFSKLVAHMKPYTPEWAEGICDVPAARIRRIANEYLDAACVGQTIEIEGKTLPYRPVAVSLGKTVTNGWGGYECCWARTLLAALVGALETPGGILGTTVRLNSPLSQRHRSVRAGPDGLMGYPFNPTDKAHWNAQPNIRNAYRSMVPLAGDNAWSQALGPTHFSWMFLDQTPPGLPRVTLPEVWFLYRTNPAISFWDTPGIEERMARFPFVVAFAFTRDETNQTMSRVVYAPPGYLLYVREQTLVAQPFDAAKQELVGEPVPLGEGLGIDNVGGASFSISSTGVLAFRAGQTQGRRLVWMDRNGKETPALEEAKNYVDTGLSPDGKRLAFDVTEPGGKGDIWIRDLARGVTSRFTFDPESEFGPNWSPDGRKIVFSKQAKAWDLFVKDAAGTGEPEPLLQNDENKYVSDWTRDGKYVIYASNNKDTNWDLWALPMTGERKPVPLVRTKFSEHGGVVSPDGRFLAYRSNESGRSEIYVQEFPEARSKWQVSAEGGSDPFWKSDGREIYYRGRDARMMAVSVQAGAAFTTGAPQPLFQARFASIAARGLYRATPDGQRFLVLAPLGRDALPPTTVVLNWLAAIKQ